jgi:hypothetical protein
MTRQDRGVLRARFADVGPWSVGAWVTLIVMAPVVLVFAAFLKVFVSFRPAPDRSPGYSPAHSKAAARLFLFFGALAGTLVSAPALAGGASTPFLLVGNPVSPAQAAPGAAKLGLGVPTGGLAAADPHLLENLGWMLGGAATVATGIAAWRKLLGIPEKPQERTIMGQPLSITRAPHYATVEEFEKLEADLKSLRSEMVSMERRVGQDMDTHFKDLDRKRSDSIGALHRKIDETNRAVGATESNIKLLLGEVRGQLAEHSRKPR